MWQEGIKSRESRVKRRKRRIHNRTKNPPMTATTDNADAGPDAAATFDGAPVVASVDSIASATVAATTFARRASGSIRGHNCCWFVAPSAGDSVPPTTPPRQAGSGSNAGPHYCCGCGSLSSCIWRWRLSRRISWRPSRSSRRLTMAATIRSRTMNN